MRNVHVVIAIVGLCLLQAVCLNSRQAGTSKAESDEEHGGQKAHSVEKSHALETASNTKILEQTPTSLSVFERRILPIFQAKNPSSCSECHLSGVDIKDYIRPTQKETFSSLVKAGLIDTKNPDQSKLLTFIRRAPEKSSLIQAKVREEEASAFQAWIRLAVDDVELLKMDASENIGPKVPVEVIRHARKDRVLASFVDSIWSEVGRCAACHSPDRNQKQVAEHGESVSLIVMNDPEATLQYLIAEKLIDAERPEHSLLLTKPTMQVKHEGGQKMVVGDRSYKQFRTFLDDYAAMKRGDYRDKSQLPEQTDEIYLATEIWMKLEDVPVKFDKMLLQVDLYRVTAGGTEEKRIATSDRQVFGGGKLWQHSLSLTAARDNAGRDFLKAGVLPPGKYVTKIYVDQTGKLEKDFRAKLTDEDFVGEVSFESRWPVGYNNMTVVRFPSEPN